MNMTKATVNYRQEKTHMMSAVDRSFTDQSTLQEDERLGLSFMDAHGYSPRGECLPLPRGPQALLPQTPEPTARSPPSADSVTPRTNRTKHPAGYQHGPWGYREGAAGDLYCALEELAKGSTKGRGMPRSSVTTIKEEMQGAAV